MDLLRELGRRPTAVAIAAKAGVSRRSIFIHFSDLDELRVAAARRQRVRLPATVEPISAELPLPERIDRFVAQLERAYEVMTPIRRVAMAGSSRVAAGSVDNVDAWLRSRAESVFAVELAGREPYLLDVVDAAVSSQPLHSSRLTSMVVPGSGSW